MTLTTRVNGKVLRVLLIAADNKAALAYSYHKFISPSVFRIVDNEFVMCGHNDGTLVIVIGEGGKARKDIEELKALAKSRKYIWTEDLT